MRLIYATKEGGIAIDDAPQRRPYIHRSLNMKTHSYATHNPAPYAAFVGAGQTISFSHSAQCRGKQNFFPRLACRSLC